MTSRLFGDPREAGEVLAGRLEHDRDRDDMAVPALPRGGVPVAFEVARALRALLYVFIVRKLGVPGPRDTCEEPGGVTGEVVCASTPGRFSAVGAAYWEFDQAGDDKVHELLAISTQAQPVTALDEPATAIQRGVSRLISGADRWRQEAHVMIGFVSRRVDLGPIGGFAAGAACSRWCMCDRRRPARVADRPRRNGRGRKGRSRMAPRTRTK